VVAPVDARQVHQSSRAAGCGCLIFMTALGYETGNLTTKRYTRAQDWLSKSPLRMVPTHFLTARARERSCFGVGPGVGSTVGP